MRSRVLVRSAAGAVVAMAGAFALPGTAQAGVLPPEFLMTWDVSNDGIGANTYNWDEAYGGFGTLHDFSDWMVGEGQDPWMVSGPWTGWRYSGSLSGPGGAWDLEWNCVFNDDVGNVSTGEGAFVTANIVVTNNSSQTENFSLLMSLPVARPILDPVASGSIVGTVTDLTFDDATVAAPTSASIYTARIDTVDEQALMTDPFSQNAGGALQSSVVGPADFGIPSPVPASQDVDDSIALFLNFDLSAGDSASFTAIFEVIPGPGALPVLATFLLVGRRRRRA